MSSTTRDDEKKTIIASYPAHELEARTKGIPVLGSGRIFPSPEETHCAASTATSRRTGRASAEWTSVGIIPFAAVEVVWDRDSDTVYVAQRSPDEGSNADPSRGGAQGVGKNCRGHGRETDGAKLWKALASLSKQYAEQGWTCCMSTRNSRMAACRWKPD